MANLPKGGCMTLTQVSIMQNVRDPLRLHLNQKRSTISKVMAELYPNTNGLSRDCSEYHAGCMGFIRDSFEPKRSKIEQEMEELWPTTNGRLQDCSEYHAGSMGFIRASFEPKISKIGPEMAKLRPIYQREVA